MRTKMLTGFWEGDDEPKWAGLCLNFGQSMEEHEPPELVAAAKSVGIILGKKPKTPEKVARRNEATERLHNRGKRPPRKVQGVAPAMGD
jgi:hypothetical protein